MKEILETVKNDKLPFSKWIAVIRGNEFLERVFPDSYPYMKVKEKITLIRKYYTG